MLTIKILAIGKVDRDYLKTGIELFITRVGHYCRCEIIELPEGNKKTVSEIIDQESTFLLDRLGEKYNDYYKILLDITGHEITSEQLAAKIAYCQNYRLGKVVFIIGGSNGVNHKIRENVNERISFSRLTFPHQIIRLLLLEQIYRSFKIIHGETYHK